MMKRNFSFFILIVVWIIVTIFGINYLVGSDSSNLYFGMSRNFKVFEKEYDKEFSLNFLKKYEDIKVVGITEDETIIGLYDPKMNYYVNSSKVITHGRYRYFSHQDYENNKNVSILSYPVIDSIQITGGSIRPSEVKEYEEEYKTNIINVFDISSTIFDYEDEIKIVKNLFSIQPKLIKKVYFDCKDQEELKMMSDEWLKNGFKVKEQAHSIFESIKVAFQGRIYVKYFLITTLLAYLLFLFTASVFLRKNHIYYNIKRISGASFSNILLKEFVPLLLVSILLSMSLSYICIRYLRWIRELSLNRNHIYEIFVFIITNVILVCSINFFINWCMTTREVR